MSKMKELDLRKQEVGHGDTVVVVTEPEAHSVVGVWTSMEAFLSEYREPDLPRYPTTKEEFEQDMGFRFEEVEVRGMEKDHE